MSMKRELGSLAGDVDLDSPRTKRRKDGLAHPEATVSMAQTSTAATANDAVIAAQSTEGGGFSGVLKEQATLLWQTVKDAVNKEGNICSPAFMRLPSKRHYPDYYNVITQPICLDDIKKKIDEDKYPSLEEVRLDFELCFSNAKRYNMKDSPIWLDAKFLLKLANKEYTKMTGRKVKKNNEQDANGDDIVEGEDDDDKKKNRPPNMNRLLKSRLQKLVEKSDEETHRVLSDVFMEMPSKKDYPSYYKQIKRPICLEYIFKRLKRKEYVSSEEFANDVELVFSNALEFNLEHSQIWEDASTLRDYFRQLMTDLPPPYSLARYTKTPGKIKLKVPGTSASTTAVLQPPADGSAAKPVQDLATSSLTLRLPAAVAKGSDQAAESSSKPIPGSTTAPVSVVPVAQLPAQKPTPTPTPVSATNPPTESSRVSTPTNITATVPSVKVIAPSPQVAIQQPTQYTPTPQFTHYPNATYHSPSAQPVATTPKPSTSTVAPPAAVNHLRTAHSVSRSPAPSLTGHRLLREVFITTKPRGRSFWLDHHDGVKSWAMRLGQGELSLSVTDIKFLKDDDRDSSDEEAEAPEIEEEEEEEEEPAPKKRGRGRPPKNPKAKVKAAAATKKAGVASKKAQKATTPSHESIHIVLNGKPVGENPDQEGPWDMELQVGLNVLEVGEKGGHVWKVYLERMATA